MAEHHKESAVANHMFAGLIVGTAVLAILDSMWRLGAALIGG